MWDWSFIVSWIRPYQGREDEGKDRGMDARMHYIYIHKWDILVEISKSRDRASKKVKRVSAWKKRRTKREERKRKEASIKRHCGRSVDVTASGPPLDSFIHHVHSTNEYCVRTWCTFLSFRLHDAYKVVIRATANCKRRYKFWFV